MDIIVTTFLTKGKDPQRELSWDKDDFSIMEKFYNSVIQNDLYCLILHDNCTKEFIEKYECNNVKFIKVKHSGLNCVDVRWGLYARLFDIFRIGRCFCCDISDVIILKNPFNFIEQGKIYCGDEPKIIKDNNWITKRFALMKGDDIQEMYKTYCDNTVLNAGIIGGSISDMRNIANRIHNILLESNVTTTTVDMCAFNHVLYTYYEDVLIHGTPVNTEFWKEDIDNQICWFKHK